MSRSFVRFSLPLTTLLFVSITLVVNGSQPHALEGSTFAALSGHQVDWEDIATRVPGAKILVLVEAENSLSLEDLALLAENKLVPADREPGLVVGLRAAVFATTAGRWIATRLPQHLSGRPLLHFLMTGIYRVSFRIEAREYEGPLTFQVTAPRSDIGKKLLSSEVVVRPRVSVSSKEDEAGNRWVTVTFPRVRYGDTIKFHFSFTYDVNVRHVLDSSLLLAGYPTEGKLSRDVLPFLLKGRKIDPNMPEAKNWASGMVGRPIDARREHKRLQKFLKQKVTYDDNKKSGYFGGFSVYTNIDDMYQRPEDTLAKGFGCCPDTVLLECAFMRALGIPCRTSGRFGHFFSEVYLVGRGWMSTSVTPTGIPLIKATGPDHLPYQKWEPAIPIRTTRWEARMRIEPLETNP